MFRRVQYFIQQAANSIFRSPVVQGVAITTITVAMLVLCVLLTLLLNLDQAADRWGREMGLVVFVSDTVDDEEQARLAHRIRGWDEVEEVVELSRSDALVDLKKALSDDAGLLDGIPVSILPASLEISLHPRSRRADVRGQLTERLMTMSGFSQVESVDYGQDLMTRVANLRELLRLGGLVVGILVLFSVIFIISNTVRLTLFSRRDEIEIMQLVGASGLFIRVPFYLEGGFQGGVSASLAVCATWLAVQALPSWGLIPGVTDDAPTVFMGPAWVIGIVAGGALVGVLASHLATGRFLRGRDGV